MDGVSQYYWIEADLLQEGWYHKRRHQRDIDSSHYPANVIGCIASHAPIPQAVIAPCMLPPI
jgi:hypothetical protein